MLFDDDSWWDKERDSTESRNVEKSFGKDLELVVQKQKYVWCNFSHIV